MITSGSERQNSPNGERLSHLSRCKIFTRVRSQNARLSARAHRLALQAGLVSRRDLPSGVCKSAVRDIHELMLTSQNDRFFSFPASSEIASIVTNFVAKHPDPIRPTLHLSVPCMARRLTYFKPCALCSAGTSSADNMLASAGSRAWHDTPTLRHSARCDCSSIPDAGRGCRGTCAPENTCPRQPPKSSSN